MNRPGGSRGKKKSLMSAEDRRLWDEVRRSVRPLASTPARSDAADPLDEVTMETAIEPSATFAAKLRRPHHPMPAYRPPAQDRPARQIAPMDDKTVRKLKKGRLAIDARVDLHGMAELQAHHALFRFLERARHEGARIVLVITGKGERSGGILRRAVPRWLAEPPMSELAGSWRVAHSSHGGEGALYVRLRRPRDNRSQAS